MRTSELATGQLVEWYIMRLFLEWEDRGSNLGLVNQSITFICAQINIIRFQNTAQKNKAPGDGENDRPVFESTTTCHKSSSVKVCFEKVQLHK